MRVEPASLDQMLHPQIDPKAKLSALASGLAASPGAAVGIAVFDADTAAKRGEKEKVILVRQETTPDDIHGMDAAQGILTANGGLTCSRPTARPDVSISDKRRRFPPKWAASSPSSCPGRTQCESSGSARTRTCRAMRSRLARSARKESDSAGPSTCSSPASVSLMSSR